MKKDPSHKDSGFSLPEGYFSDLEERIRKRMQQMEEKDGFKAPEGYFETLGERILEKVKENAKENAKDNAKENAKENAKDNTKENAKEHANVKTTATELADGVIPINRKLWKLAVAAAITILVAGSTWMIQTNTQGVTFDTLPLTDIEWLLERGALEIPQQYLIEEANDTLLMELSMAEHAIDDKMLENYLTEEADLYELLD